MRGAERSCQEQRTAFVPEAVRNGIGRDGIGALPDLARATDYTVNTDRHFRCQLLLDFVTKLPPVVTQ